MYKIFLLSFFFSITGCMQNKYADFIHTSVPANINPESRYLFFLHGKIVEKQGLPATSRLYGYYDYYGMLDTFASEDFNVISEVRQSGTEIYDYAHNVAEQVEQLLNLGVPESHITISGFSKGGRMTLIVSSLLNYKEIRYVILAGCRSTDIENFNLNPSGKVLSIYDLNDDRFESCSDIYSEGKDNLYADEIVLRLGKGHGVFYNPTSEWVTPMIKWAKQ